MKRTQRSICFILGLVFAACGTKIYYNNDPSLSSQLEVADFVALTMERYPHPFSILVDVEVDQAGKLVDAAIHEWNVGESTPESKLDWGSLSLLPSVQRAALDAVERSSYTPARVGDQPVRQRRSVLVSFNANAEPITPPTLRDLGAGSRPPEGIPIDMLSGEVLVELLIGIDGKVDEAIPLSGSKLLYRVATEMSLRTTFSPALLRGEPVPVRICFLHEFRVRRG